MLTYEQRMAVNIGCDIDGTLLDYGHRQGEPHLLNTALCEQLRGNNIHLITNQGGLPFGIAGAVGFPTPADFLARLEFLVADDYGTKTNVTGTNKTALNSDIKDFESTCIGAANANTGLGLYGYMSELEDTITQKASLQGFTNVEWVWVMHPTHWAALVKYLPYEMLGDGGTVLAGGASVMNNNVSVVVNDMGIATIRQQLQSSMRLNVNGRTYMVILDDSMPIAQTGSEAPYSNTGDIYFLPLTVEGQPVLFWESADYRELTNALEPIPGGLGSLHGHVDGGMKLVTARHNGFCFLVQAKMELGLVLLAPQLSGKISNVTACVLQSKTVFNSV